MFDILTRPFRARRLRTLMLFGIVYAINGAASLGTGDAVARNPSYQAHVRFLSFDTWSWVFITIGTFAIGCSFRAQWAWIGYAALMALTSVWSFEFFASWIGTGYHRAAVGGLIWLLIVALLADHITPDVPHFPPRGFPQ